MVLGFALVMRLQIAYQRLWEGATNCHQASAKWADAAMQVICFDEISKDAFTADAFEFRMLILHYTSLMNACALIDMRMDDSFAAGLMPINREDPFLFRPNTTQALVPVVTHEGEATMSKPKNSVGSEYSASGVSERAHTVPLQRVLHTRQALMDKTGQKFDSFDAIDAMERAVQPVNYIPKSRRHEATDEDSSSSHNSGHCGGLHRGQTREVAHSAAEVRAAGCLSWCIHMGHGEV